jgi:hypothetical protein
VIAVDAKDCRTKADLCLRLADGLSLNNPARLRLIELAEDFRKRAKELEVQAAQPGPQSKSDNAE